jgi:hypothetical protein
MEFDIKKGHGSSLEGDGLKNIMTGLFDDVKEENGAYVASFGPIKRLEVKLLSKNLLSVTSEADKTASEEDMAVSHKKYNVFMEQATGFTSKERSKRLQKKAKEGKI